MNTLHRWLMLQKKRVRFFIFFGVIQYLVNIKYCNPRIPVGLGVNFVKDTAVKHVTGY